MIIQQYRVICLKYNVGYLISFCTKFTIELINNLQLLLLFFKFLMLIKKERGEQETVQD